MDGQTNGWTEGRTDTTKHIISPDSWSITTVLRTANGTQPIVGWSFLRIPAGNIRYFQSYKASFITTLIRCWLGSSYLAHSFYFRTPKGTLSILRRLMTFTKKETAFHYGRVTVGDNSTVACRKNVNLKIIVVIPKEGLAGGAPPILLLVRL